MWIIMGHNLVIGPLKLCTTTTQKKTITPSGNMERVKTRGSLVDRRKTAEKDY